MASTRKNFSFLFLLISLLIKETISMDYKQALSNSLLYFEAQRSGKLPPQQRVTWRGDSGLNDGQDVRVNLIGGYYDAGDNVKFGFPMAFTVTLLAWSVVEYGPHLEAQNELQNALAAIKWGADFFVEAHPSPNILYAGVGDGDSDHQCWERPEDMTTPRTVYRIDEKNPGSDLAAETAAALAAASIAFKRGNPGYSLLLLSHARQDELLWAAAWLQRATGEKIYEDFFANSNDIGGARRMFSWDDKFVGAQVLIAKQVLEGKVPSTGIWAQYKANAEQFVCNCIGKGNNNFYKTNGGLLWFNDWDNLQYTTSASLVLTIYADYLIASRKDLVCPSSRVGPIELIDFAKSQVNYILGSNPMKTSYMVGYGSTYPQQIHHRGSSIVSIKKDPTPIGCKDGFTKWFEKNQPNPNVLVGAIVGGPGKNDNYVDQRGNYKLAEAATANSAGLVGVLARIC